MGEGMDLSLKRLEEALRIRRQIDSLERRLFALIGGGRSTSTSTSSKKRAGRCRMSAATRVKLAAPARGRWARGKRGGTAREGSGNTGPKERR